MGFDQSVVRRLALVKIDDLPNPSCKPPKDAQYIGEVSEQTRRWIVATMEKADEWYMANKTEDRRKFARKEELDHRRINYHEFWRPWSLQLLEDELNQARHQAEALLGENQRVSLQENFPIRVLVVTDWKIVVTREPVATELMVWNLIPPLDVLPERYEEGEVQIHIPSDPEGEEDEATA